MPADLFCALGCVLAFAAAAYGGNRWTELNIGPFRVDTDQDPQEAREALATLEQLRWILAGMLESKDLTATWPVRILLTSRAGTSPQPFIEAHGEYVLAVPSRKSISFPAIAKLFIEANTPRLPPEVETQLPNLFEGLEAHGSRVTWGAPPAHPDLDWARLQLFATKAEYAGRFPIFLNNLRGGSALRTAEANAFGSDSQSLEREAQQYLSNGEAHPQTISARPLDPKRDFGQHSLDDSLAELYLADTKLDRNAKDAEAAYKSAIQSGHVALGQEGLARVVMREGTDPSEYLDASIAAGSKDAWVYAERAKHLPEAQAIALLRTAAELNSRWYEPVYLQAQFTKDPAAKEALLVQALKVNPRLPDVWRQLAELQSANGKTMSAQNSWARAEDNAASAEQRERIHRAREAAESSRLDAEEAARREKENAARAEDERLRKAQMQRIHAAEQRANGAAAGDTNKSSNVLHWWSDENPSVEGQLTRVDCLDKSARLWIKPASGKPVELLVKNPSEVNGGNSSPLTCGAQSSSRRLSVTYKPRADSKFGTAGDVTSIHFE